MVVTFPKEPIIPRLDHTEWAFHRVAEIVNDFEHALVDASSCARATQIRERIAACGQMLHDVEMIACARENEF